MLKRTTEEFVKLVTEKHNGFYNYDKVIYTGSLNKITITCPIHGDFIQEASSHLQGCGCYHCHVNSLKSNKAKFISDSVKVHGDTYNYNKVNYKSSYTKVEIVCKKHGSFLQTPSNHKSGLGCKKCGTERRGLARQLPWEEFILKSQAALRFNYIFDKNDYKGLRKPLTAICKHHGPFMKTAINFLHGSDCEDCLTDFKRENFIKNCREKFGDKYDYSDLNFKNLITHVNVVCPVHGTFKVKPQIFLESSGCPECELNDRKQHFLKRAKEIHGDKYDYSDVNYVNSNERVTIKCPTHGKFLQSPAGHVSGYGCFHCGIISRRLDKQKFVSRANQIHSGYYNYDNAVYVDRFTKLTINCPIHGDFDQTPEIHLKGCGCVICNRSFGESAIVEILNKKNIRYELEYRLPDTRYRYDFYLPDYNILIEFHGIQHFKYVEYFHRNVEEFNRKKFVDEVKVKLAKAWRIPLLIFTYKQFELPPSDFEDLLMGSILRYEKQTPRKVSGDKRNNSP